jgi:hypothetical protein
MRIIAEESIGLVVDIQERLFPHIADRQALLDRTRCSSVACTCWACPCW